MKTPYKRIPDYITEFCYISTTLSSIRWFGKTDDKEEITKETDHDTGIVSKN